MDTSSPWCQRNPLWAGRPLGTAPGSTLERHGCLVSAAARMLSRVRPDGLSWTPWELNKALVGAEGFENGNLLRFGMLERIEPWLRFRERVKVTGPFSVADEQAVAAFVDAGGQVLVQVDFDPIWKSGQQEHWLHLDYLVPGPRFLPYHGWYCFDPWWGEIVEVGEYYSPCGKHLDYAMWGYALYEVIDAPPGSPSL